MEIILPLIQNEASLPNKISFDGVIGQENVVKKMQFFIQAHMRSYPIPTFLFTGSHGLGKTYIAEKVANNLGRRFIVINAKTVEKAPEFIEEVMLVQIQGATPVTILIDESHSISKDITTILLTLLNPNKDNKNYLKYKNVAILWDMSKINMIFATTDAYEMFGPLKSRCENVYFDSYSDKEMLGVLEYYLPNVHFKCDLEDLSKACRSRARDAYLLAKNIERFCTIERINIIGNKEWNKIKQIFDIKPMGINKHELSLLEFIYTHAPISCANIATSMMTNVDSIRYDTEVRLRELDFISNTNKGRIVTEKGKKYLGDITYA